MQDPTLNQVVTLLRGARNLAKTMSRYDKMRYHRAKAVFNHGQQFWHKCAGSTSLKHGVYDAYSRGIWSEGILYQGKVNDYHSCLHQFVLSHYKQVRPECHLSHNAWIQCVTLVNGNYVHTMQLPML